MKVRLSEIAHARSGDKGTASNVGLIANSPALYEVVRREVTSDRVGHHFRKIVHGPVERFEVPNLRALNFLLNDSLGGGGTESLKNDAQGKTHGQGLLQMEVDVPEELLGLRRPLAELEYENLVLRRDRDLLWVTLDNPDKANALSPRMVDEIIDLYRRPLLEDGVRAVLLKGTGKHFSAGADLKHLESLRYAGAAENRRDSERLRAIFDAVLSQRALTVALVHGSCVAGGCGLATAHDYVVASANARFMYSEVKIGFVAALVATFLPLRVKGRDLRELLLHPRFVDAREAREIGLVNRVVAPEELESAGEALVAEVLANASSESIARTKQLLLEAIGRPLDEALERAAVINAEARATDDCRRGIATFLETKKPPVWR